MNRISLIVLLFILSCTDSTSHSEPICIAEPEVIAESNGCGNAFVYQPIDSIRTLTVSISSDSVEFTGQCQTYRLESAPPGILVNLDVRDDGQDMIVTSYCEDVVNVQSGSVYNAVSGELSFFTTEIQPVEYSPGEFDYNITVEIRDLRLVNETTGNEFFINHIVFWDVWVGWLPG